MNNKRETILDSFLTKLGADIDFFVNKLGEFVQLKLNISKHGILWSLYLLRVLIMFAAIAFAILENKMVGMLIFSMLMALSLSKLATLTYADASQKKKLIESKEGELSKKDHKLLGTSKMLNITIILILSITDSTSLHIFMAFIFTDMFDIEIESMKDYKNTDV